MKRSALLVVALLPLAACDASGESTESGRSKSVEVVYEVTGDTRYADVTVSTPSGTSQQSVLVPIVNDGGTNGLIFTMRHGSRAYIAAQNGDDDSFGPITCRITVDGVALSENSSSGKFAIATCKGTV